MPELSQNDGIALEDGARFCSTTYGPHADTCAGRQRQNPAMISGSETKPPCSSLSRIIPRNTVAPSRLGLLEDGLIDQQNGNAIAYGVDTMTFGASQRLFFPIQRKRFLADRADQIVSRRARHAANCSAVASGAEGGGKLFLSLPGPAFSIASIAKSKRSWVRCRGWFGVS